jgi:hypothetical protein
LQDLGKVKGGSIYKTPCREGMPKLFIPRKESNPVKKEDPVDFYNLEDLLTQEGTESVHTLIIGQDLTGISAFH